MDFRNHDVEIGFPIASAGTDGDIEKNKPSKKSKTKKRGKKKHTGTKTSGGSGKKKSAPPPNNTKKLVLAAGILLCIVSFIAILLVISGNYESSYNTSMPQFTGVLQMEELDGEIITWTDDYNDLSSPQSEGLKQVLTSKLSSAFREEGLATDAVTITEFSPAEPQTIVITKVVQSRARRAAVFSAVGSTPPKVTGSGQTYVTPDEIYAMKVETVERPAVSFVSTAFATMGTPSKNAAAVAASNGRWSSVSSIIESRMASEGVGVTIDKIEPDKEFLDSVARAIEEKPEIAIVPPAGQIPAEVCTCHANGNNFKTTSRICQCESSCVQPDAYIYGGKDDQFAGYSPICLAAYYAGFIQDEGGVVEALNLNVRKVENGGPKRGITPWNIGFAANTFRVKRVGPVLHFQRTPDDIAKQMMATDEAGKLFTIHLHYLTVDGESVSFVPAMANIKNSKSQELADKVKPKIKSAVEAQGFTVQNVEISQILSSPTKTGIILGVDVIGSGDTNVQNAVKLESDSTGALPTKITQSMETKDTTVRSFRYAKAFLEEMTESMKSDSP